VPGPRDFDGKPIWARTLVISAGVIMNMVFAFFLYTFVAGFWGIRDLATTRVGAVSAEFVPAGSEALTGIPLGAEIVEVGGVEVVTWGDLTTALVEAEAGPLTIDFRRPLGRVEVLVPATEEDRIRLALSLQPWYDAVVGAVTPGGPADKAGVQEGDRILSVDGTPILNWSDFLQAILPRPNARVEVGLQRGTQELIRNVSLAAQVRRDPETGERIQEGQIGIYRPPDDLVYTPVGFKDAVRAGYLDTVHVTGRILDFLKNLVTGNVSPRSVGSIVTIGEESGRAAAQGLEYFLGFMALFSVNLAILNLLPIPVLDGGHLVFLAIEALRGGNPLSVEQRLRWSQVGFVVLLGIMVWALSNDFMRLFGF
jgi:regulator of sigma E protease